MKNKCNIVKDILPLYLEDMISEDTRKFVDSHIDHCDKCKEELESLKSNNTNNELEGEDSIKALKKIKFDILKKQIVTAIISALIPTIIITLSVAYLTAPKYLAYSEVENSFEVYEVNDYVNVSFIGEYELHQLETGIYEISVYDTLWNKIFNPTIEQTITINPDGEKIDTVYYISNNGEDLDQVIYGESGSSGSGRITLPRLFIGSYFYLAAIVFIVALGVLVIFKRNEKIKNILLNILWLPISYMISSIAITGLNMDTYSSSRDVYLILILTTMIYCLTHLLSKRIRKPKV